MQDTGLEPDEMQEEPTRKQPSVQEGRKGVKEAEEVIKAVRSASTAGPSGIPYLVYKHCPELLLHLSKILKVICQRGRVAD